MGPRRVDAKGRHREHRDYARQWRCRRCRLTTTASPTSTDTVRRQTIGRSSNVSRTLSAPSFRNRMAACCCSGGRGMCSAGIRMRACPRQGDCAHPVLARPSPSCPTGACWQPAGKQVTMGDGNVQARTTAEVFDPSTGRSEAIASMPEPRNNAAAVTLDDGSVLVVGGWVDAKTAIPRGARISPTTRSAGRPERRRAGETASRAGRRRWAASRDLRRRARGATSAVSARHTP